MLQNSPETYPLLFSGGGNVNCADSCSALHSKQPSCFVALNYSQLATLHLLLQPVDFTFQTLFQLCNRLNCSCDVHFCSETPYLSIGKEDSDVTPALAERRRRVRSRVQH